MAIILGIDALEPKCVERFGCKNLMQTHYGKTDISEFSEPRTIVLWSSFLSGKNQEARILGLGNIQMWEFKLKPEETFFPAFKNYKAIDVPGFSYGEEQHETERENLKKFFNKEISEEEFDAPVFAHHRNIKQQFFEELEKKHDLLMVYFNVADVIGHVSFGNEAKTRMIYRDLDDIAKSAAQKREPMLIVSDHGMKAIGPYGDHETYGFWSTNTGKDLGRPRITDFCDFIRKGMK